MDNDFETVSVHGLGYIGLPTAVLIASRGKRVIGVDVNERVTSSIMEGKVDVREPDLDGLLQKVVSNGMLTAQVDPVPSDVFLIAVPTPLTTNGNPTSISSNLQHGALRRCCAPETSSFWSRHLLLGLPSVCAKYFARNARI